jgi:Tfp pilus assembly protein PilF
MASVLLTDSINNEKKTAKSLLEKAVKIDPGYLNAVYLLSNLYIDEKNHDKAIEM